MGLLVELRGLVQVPQAGMAAARLLMAWARRAVAGGGKYLGCAPTAARAPPNFAR